MNVYDFDDTIYDGESCLDFFFYYIKKTPYLIKYIPRALYAVLRYKMGKVTVEQALEKYAPMVEEYLASVEDLEADCEDFWEQHMHKIRPFYKDLQQPDDIIVTGSPEVSVKVICERLGIKHYVGSIIDKETGKITRLCMRSQKIPAFLEAYPDVEIDNFYTDSAKNDKPLIDMAKHAFLVKGNKIIQIK